MIACELATLEPHPHFSPKVIAPHWTRVSGQSSARATSCAKSAELVWPSDVQWKRP